MHIEMRKKENMIFVGQPSNKGCCNLNLGLTTNARACKVASQERKPRSERKCEGMNPHIPKGASTLGVGVSVDSQMFREQFQGSKPNGLRSSLYHWKSIET
jgi:hypothetical protein